MYGVRGLKMSIKNVASTTFKLAARNHSVAALSVSSFDEKAKKVIHD